MMNAPANRLIAVVKRDCPTCSLVAPVLAQLAQSETALTVYTQDDPAFPADITDGVVKAVDDTELAYSFRMNIEIVPTLIRFVNDEETERIVGWNRTEWQSLTGVVALGPELPPFQPGCGSKSVEPGMEETLAFRFGQRKFRARQIEVGVLEDEMEVCFEHGWTDGLPVVPPTEARVARMLAGTSRDAQEIVGVIPPDYVECTVEKVAINAVMAGCKPAYLPVVLAAVEAACLDAFCMHGLLATTYFSGPIVIVNGPITQAIGMNSGVNVLGQGNRANATIGRALQLIIRNVGGGLPGGVDRATFGTPGKYTFCFAEDEAGSPWESLAVERGFAADVSTLTLFAGGGVQGMLDQKSRAPESLARSFAACLRVVLHPKLVLAADACLVVSPEHGRVFREAGWSKAQLKEALQEMLTTPADDLLSGVDGIAEGLPEHLAGKVVTKFRPGGLNIVHAGSKAGMFSAIIGGWAASGQKGSQPVTVEIRP